jgi:hypothetical protein
LRLIPIEGGSLLVDFQSWQKTSTAGESTEGDFFIVEISEVRRVCEQDVVQLPQERPLSTTSQALNFHDDTPLSNGFIAKKGT